MKNRLGETNINRYGSLMEVVEYKGSMNILVKFEQGNLVPTNWQHFINGKVKNPYDRSVHGVGFLGEGDYRAIVNGQMTNQYNTWQGMLERCYSETWHTKYPTYKNCYVDETFHNFQNFAKWYDQNYYEIEGERISLDKDIFKKNNKVYSPETCIFVPQRINVLFTKCNTRRGEFPIGVSWDKQYKKYKATCSNKGKDVNLGRFEKIEEAFKAYKDYKEQLIKHTAEEYKNKIPTKLYEAMINYKVEIND